MDVSEITALTEDAVANLLVSRAARSTAHSNNGRRQAPRWPFPGTVQLWVPDKGGTDVLHLATCINLSLHGLGMLCEIPLPVGMELTVAIHQPETSFQGRAAVRHCTDLDGRYYAGVEFLFQEP